MIKWLNLAAFSALLIVAWRLRRLPPVQPWAVALGTWALNNALFYTEAIWHVVGFGAGALNIWSAVTKLQAVVTALAILAIVTRSEWKKARR